VDPFKLAVSPEQFEAHLQLLSKLGEPLSVSELSQRIASGTLSNVGLTVTFDDGYEDNLSNAKPLLERRFPGSPGYRVVELPVPLGVGA